MIPPLVGMDELRLAGVGAWPEFELLTLGVHKYLHQGRPLISDWHYGIVDEDEGVDPRVRDGPRRQRFEDIEAHHRTNVGVLD